MNVVLMNVGPNPDGFFDFFETELAEALRRSPAGAPDENGPVGAGSHG